MENVIKNDGINLLNKKNQYRNQKINAMTLGGSSTFLAG